MASVLHEQQLETLCRRVASLKPSATAQWGRMNVGSMLGHLCQSTRMALGELPVKPLEKRAFATFPLKHLILYVAPFPRGASTAPELLVDDSAPFDANQALLNELLRRLGAGPRTGIGPVHPLLGQLSRGEWGVLMHKHIDHHLRQFDA